VKLRLVLGTSGNSARRPEFQIAWNCDNEVVHSRLNSDWLDCLRLQSSHPFHPFAGGVEERIASEVFLEGMGPTARLGARPSFLFQDGKDGCRGFRERPRGKQPKASNSVLIAFRNVLGPTVNELFQRTLHVNRPMLLFVFVPKPNGSLPDVADTTLRNGWPPCVAAGRSEGLCMVDRELSLSI
jgi:hypothetical protein